MQAVAYPICVPLCTLPDYIEQSVRAFADEYGIRIIKTLYSSHRAEAIGKEDFIKYVNKTLEKGI